jgi:dTDP-4-amino-4,6-dideoxygalactose transaminase
MPDIRIPFNRPWQSGRELEYIGEVVSSGHLSGDGEFTRRCQSLLATGFGHDRSLLTTSCTDALEMCALLLDLKPGDEVIVPSFTFVSSVNAFLIHGANPVFADVLPGTLNIDPASVRAHLSEHTRAIIVVHYAGVGCAMGEILGIAEEHGLVVIEDNAHGLGGAYRGKPLGSMGALATLSFHETKNFTSGEGGALIVNDAAYFERAEIIREKGTERSKFFRGQVDKYGWVDVGSSFLPSELVAAHLCAQLEESEKVQQLRAEIWLRYASSLAEWASQHEVLLPSIPPECDQAFHMFYMLMPDLATRTKLIDCLRMRAILAVFHYLPLHLSPMGRRLGHAKGECPVTENISDRLVRLPFYTGLTEVQQCEVIAAVQESLS